MSTLPGARTGVPMMPLPVYPGNPDFMHAAETTQVTKGTPPATRPVHAPLIAAATQPPVNQETGQQLVSVPLSHGKPSSEQLSADTTEGAGGEGSRLKVWKAEETLELIHLYRKYLPDFHQHGQRKVNVWQRVTHDMVAKGYANFSWADCSAKFRSLRDSYRRTTTGGRALTWQFYPHMKEVMKLEKLLLDQDSASGPAPRPHRPPITCQQDTPLAPALPPNPAAQDGEGHGQGEAGPREVDDAARKRLMPDNSAATPAKKAKDYEQEAELVIGRNLSGEPVKAKVRSGGVVVNGGLQALGRGLSLPQTQLVVGDDGRVVQTTSTPTGLWVSESGQLSSVPAGQAPRQGAAMPQWFRLYEKRARAESSRRLEELKEMHQESLQLQRQALDVAKQKNDLLRNLADSLAEFKALLQR